ncbi:MAG: cyanophycin synthetase [Geminicoccaceae bacterium]|nr:cyanophycin synthetase [Geminicoccaceae bacterium]
MSQVEPATEMRMTALHATRGANYWSRLPVTRMDLTTGAYDEISSADVPGVTGTLLAALPGLVEHRCSIGERGGFIARLRRGTYVPHIIEHVALELQGQIGHDVGYGRTRGGDVPGEYTVVFEHVSDVVGLRAAALAFDIVQRAFAGTLETVEHAIAELRALADQPSSARITQHVCCGITGGALRAETRTELARRGVGDDDTLVVDVAPGYILQAGLPYAHSDLAIVLDDRPTDVPERYRDPERASRLVSVVADAVPEGGIVIAPAKAWDVQDRARDAGCRVAVFAADASITGKDKKVARAAAWTDDGRILIEHADATVDAGRVHGDAPVEAQVAAALAVFTLAEMGPHTSDVGVIMENAAH